MPDSSEVPTEEHTAEVGLESLASVAVTLPEDIISELDELDNRFVASANKGVFEEYEKIGALQLLQRVPKEDIHEFGFENGPAILLSTHPVLDDAGEVIAYDVYRVNPTAVTENPDEITRINKLSHDYMSRIRGEKLKLLDAAVQQGRATDLGEMSVSEWSGLPGKGLDDCAKVHLYDETGAPLGKVRVYQVHTA